MKFTHSKKLIAVLLLLSLLAAVPAFACTIYSAAGSAVEGGGTLIGKNRDASPMYQKMFLNTDGKYAYYCLVGDAHNKFTGKVTYMGVNEKGLTVINAFTSSIATDAFNKMRKMSSLKFFMANCASVEEAISHSEKFTGPSFVMFSDGREIAIVEVGTKGRFVVKRTSDGTLTHTNYYMESEFSSLNMIPESQWSTARQSRIDELMANTAKPLTFDDFISFSEDSVLWRAPKPTGTQTLASLIVQTQPDGDFKLRLKYRQQPKDGGNEVILEKTREEIFGNSNR